MTAFSMYNTMAKKDEEGKVDCFMLAEDTVKSLAGKYTINEAMTACCYAISLLMVAAETTNPRNSSEGVPKMCGEAIPKTYDAVISGAIKISYIKTN